MSSVTVYHNAPSTDLAAILRDGLRYGAQGEHSQEPHAARTNRYLDKHRPAGLSAAGVSRQDCLYAFLALDGLLIEVNSGRPLKPAVWKPDNDKSDKVKLRLVIDPRHGYVGDLETYDRLASALTQGAPALDLAALANRYWAQCLPLSVVTAHYEPSDTGGIRRKPGAPATLPAFLPRVEVMLTADVPAKHINQI